VARTEVYLHVKFHLDPSNCLATFASTVSTPALQTDRQTDRQTGRQDRTGQTVQRSDSIGRTVLRTVAQKSVQNSTFSQKSVVSLYGNFARRPLWRHDPHTSILALTFRRLCFQGWFVIHGLWICYGQSVYQI